MNATYFTHLYENSNDEINRISDTKKTAAIVSSSGNDSGDNPVSTVGSQIQKYVMPEKVTSEIIQKDQDLQQIDLDADDLESDKTQKKIIARYQNEPYSTEKEENKESQKMCFEKDGNSSKSLIFEDDDQALLLQDPQARADSAEKSVIKKPDDFEKIQPMTFDNTVNFKLLSNKQLDLPPIKNANSSKGIDTNPIDELRQGQNSPIGAKLQIQTFNVEEINNNSLPNKSYLSDLPKNPYKNSQSPLQSTAKVQIQQNSVSENKLQIQCRYCNQSKFCNKLLCCNFCILCCFVIHNHINLPNSDIQLKGVKTDVQSYQLGNKYIIKIKNVFKFIKNDNPQRQEQQREKRTYEKAKITPISFEKFQQLQLPRENKGKIHESSQILQHQNLKKSVRAITEGIVSNLPIQIFPAQADSQFDEGGPETGALNPSHIQFAQLDMIKSSTRPANTHQVLQEERLELRGSLVAENMNQMDQIVIYDSNSQKIDSKQLPSALN